ncbi:MAG: FAD-dependent oxidoreductase, partial [Chloroflexota bacterium]
MADFVIIGGGIYGCGTAWELAKLGAEVVLLEASSIASGASGGLGKRGVRANGRDVRELPLMREAYDIWPTLHEQLEGETGYSRTGHLLLIERELDKTREEAQVWVQQKNGIPTEWLDANAVRDKEPFVSEAVIAATYCPLDGVSDHTATTQSYAKAAQSLGATIRENTAVSHLEKKGDMVTAVLTTAGKRIPVNKAVLLASNRHAVPFVQKELGITLPLWLLYPQVMNTTPIAPMPLNHLIGHAHRTLAMKGVPGNHVMISGGWHGRLNPNTQQIEPVPEQVEGNRLEAVAAFPCLADLPIAEVSVERGE